MYLFHLEFDCGFDLIHLGVQVLIVGEKRWELSGFVQARTQNTRDLLNQGLGGQEGIIFLCCGVQARYNYSNHEIYIFLKLLKSQVC